MKSLIYAGYLLLCLWPDILAFSTESLPVKDFISPPLEPDPKQQNLELQTHSPSVSIRFKNAYFNRKYLNSNEIGLADSNWIQWAQGMVLAFDSPYLDQVLGVNAAVFNGFKLYGTNPTSAGSNQLIHTLNNGTKYSDQYARLGLFNLKLNLERLFKYPIIVRYGLISANTAFTNDCNQRLFPVTYQGFGLLASPSQHLKYYGYCLSRIGFPAASTYAHFVNGSGTILKRLWIAGASYQFDLKSKQLQKPSLQFKAEFGHSYQYLNGLFAQCTYQHPLDQSGKTNRYWLLDAQYRFSFEGGKLWDSGRRPSNTSFCHKCLATKRSVSTLSTGNWFKTHAQNLNINLKLVRDQWFGALSYTYTSSPSIGVGMDANRYHYALIANDCGSGTFWTSRHISSFNYDREKAFQINAGYDFSQALTGLAVEATGTYGVGIHPQVGLKDEKEIDISLKYSSQLAGLKGFSLGLDYSYYASRAVPGNTYDAIGYKISDLRWFVQFQTKLL